MGHMKCVYSTVKLPQPELEQMPTDWKLGDWGGGGPVCDGPGILALKQNTTQHTAGFLCPSPQAWWPGGPSKVHWVNLAQVSKQTDKQMKPKLPVLRPSSSVNNSLAYNYIVGGGGGQQPGPAPVMAPTTQPQILPKEGDSFFSSLWNWFKWPFKTDLVSLAYWRAAMQTVISLFIWAVSFPSFSSLSPFLLPTPLIFFFFCKPRSLREETPLPVIFRKTRFFFGYVKIQ